MKFVLFITLVCVLNISYVAGQSDLQRIHIQHGLYYPGSTSNAVIDVDSSGRVTYDREPFYQSRMASIAANQEISTNKSNSVEIFETYQFNEEIVLINVDNRELKRYDLQMSLIESKELKINRPLFWVKYSDQLYQDNKTGEIYLMTHCSKGYLWYIIDVYSGTSEQIATYRHKYHDPIWSVRNGEIYLELSVDGEITERKLDLEN